MEMPNRRTSNQLASPKVIAKRQHDKFLEDRNEQKNICVQLKVLVNSQGWLYAKDVARQILELYATVPPTTEQGLIRFTTGNIMRFAYEAFVQVIERAAETGVLSLPTPGAIPHENGDNGSNRKN
jgi:hypothetical protein